MATFTPPVDTNPTWHYNHWRSQVEDPHTFRDLLVSRDPDHSHTFTHFHARPVHVQTNAMRDVHQHRYTLWFDEGIQSDMIELPSGSRFNLTFLEEERTRLARQLREANEYITDLENQ